MSPAMCDIVGGGGGGGGDEGGEHTACTICFDPVDPSGSRAIARLNCLHEFHLDCIGSAFNTKGVMQCPNCRKVEEGNWIYVKSCCSVAELDVEDEDPDGSIISISSDTTSESRRVSFHELDQGPLDSEVVADDAYSGSSPPPFNFDGRTIRTIVSACPYLNNVQSVPFEGELNPHQENHVVGAESIQTSNAMPSRFWGFPSTSAQSSYHTNNSDQPSMYSAMSFRRYNVDNHLPTDGSNYQQLMQWPPSRPELSYASYLLPIDHSYPRLQSLSNQVYNMYNPDTHRPAHCMNLVPIGPALYNGYPANCSCYYLVSSCCWILQDMEGLAPSQTYAWEGDRGVHISAMVADRGFTQHGPSFYSRTSGSGGAGVGDQDIARL